MPLHRHHLGRLMLERVEAVKIADDDLDGATRASIHIAIENILRTSACRAAQQVPGPDPPTTSAVVR
jgi:hypothetical protein